MNVLCKVLLVFCFSLLTATASFGHFGMVIPSDNIIEQPQKKVKLTLSFSHPFEEIGMELVKPKEFSVYNGDSKVSLLNSLKPKSVMGHPGWEMDYAIKRPGLYQFVMEPQPYWEPAEDLFIIHYTKTVVAAFGEDQGWDAPLGLPTEIVPLLRPFGNYAGNSFVGQVLLSGEPVPYAEVEVELYNQNRFKVISDYHITQVIKADANGIFSFTCPESGWWGFAALNEADYTLKTDKGEVKGIELGAVLWIYLDEYKKK